MIEPQFLLRVSIIYDLSDKMDPIARDKLKVHLRQPCRATKNVEVDEAYFGAPPRLVDRGQCNLRMIYFSFG